MATSETPTHGVSESELRVLVAKLLESKGLQIQFEVPVRRGLNRRVVDLIAKGKDVQGKSQMLVFEIRSQPASVDTISALEMAPGDRKFVVSPGWSDDSSKQYAESAHITLIRPEEIKSQLVDLQ